MVQDMSAIGWERDGMGQDRSAITHKLGEGWYGSGEGRYML